MYRTGRSNISMGPCIAAFAPLIALLTPVGAHAGPWTRAPGRYYAKAGQSMFLAEGFRDQAGRFNSDTTYLGLSSTIYGELGLVEDLQTQLYLPFVVSRNDFEPDSALRLGTRCENGLLVRETMRRSFGDASLGLQYTTPLLEMPHAVRINGKLPLYDVTEPAGRCSALFPQPGDGQVDLDLWVSLGDSFDAGRFFLFGELGHRVRTELYLGDDSGRRFGDTLLSFAQFGWQAWPGAFVMWNVTFSVPYLDDAVTKGSLSLGPAVYLPLTGGLALEGGVELTPWSTNSAAGVAKSLFWTGANIGISHTYN